MRKAESLFKIYQYVKNSTNQQVEKRAAFQGLSECKKLNESAGRKENSISRFIGVKNFLVYSNSPLSPFPSYIRLIGWKTVRAFQGLFTYPSYLRFPFISNSTGRKTGKSISEFNNV